MEGAPGEPPSFPVTTIPGSPSSRQVLAACPPRFPRKPECSVFFEGFLARLNACHDAVAVHDDQWKNKYCELLKRFMKLLRRQPLLERLAGADTIAYTFRELNMRLDAICVGIEYAANDQWMADWSHGCEVQAQQLESLVTGTAARMLIRDMASEQKVTTAMLEMYTWLEGNTPGPLPDLKRATLERLRVALDLEARVITSETVAGIQGQTDNILSIFPWFIPERDVEVNEGGLIYAGIYGTVDYGTWRRRDGTIQDVVVKSMFDRSINSELSFLRQLQLWYELPRHPNIIQLHGGCHRARQPFFVCENAPGGNIFQFFSEPENGDLFWGVFLQVAQGLQFLHEHHIVHDSLTSGNILIGENNTPKISDFDCSLTGTIRAGYSVNNQKSQESVRWKPRERIVEASSSLPRYKSDVYSLGMCMIGAKTQGPPFGLCGEDEVMEMVLSGMPYEQPDGICDDEWGVIRRFIAADIEDRPDVDEVILMISRWCESELSFPIEKLVGCPPSRKVLASLYTKSERVPENEKLCRQMLERLMFLHDAVSPLPATDRGKQQTIHHLHLMLTEIGEGLGLGNEAAMTKWSKEWDSDCADQRAKLVQLVTTASDRSLVNELHARDEKQVRQALMVLKTSTKETTGQSTEISQLKKTTLDRVLAFTNEAGLRMFDWFINVDDIKYSDTSNVIGTGGSFGDVSLGTWFRDGQPIKVVVKHLFPELASTSDKAFLQQLELWWRLPRNEHILELASTVVYFALPLNDFVVSVAFISATATNRQPKNPYFVT
ncbi:hypothetical protein PRNP1_011911 [Phytophthora ramorum]